MTNSLPPTSFQPAKFAQASTARRTASAKAAADSPTSFDDLLPDNKARETETERKASTDSSQRLKPSRRDADDGAAVSVNPSLDLTVRERPMQAILNAPNPPRGDRSEPAAEDATIDPNTVGGDSTGRVSLATKPLVIEPHGPPVNSDPVEITPNPPKLPPVDPLDPPVVDDPALEPTGGVKAPLPVGTGDLPGNPTGKLPAIHPHGPVFMPPGGVDTKPTVVRDDDVPAIPVSDTPMPSSVDLPAGAPKGPFTTTPPNPIAGNNAPVMARPALNNTGREIKGAIPVSIDPAMEIAAVHPPAANPSDAASALPVTTAAQAQLAAATAAPASAGTAVVAVSELEAANLAALGGQTPNKSDDSSKGSYSQTSEGERLTSRMNIGGTTAAKRQTNVTTAPTNPANASGRAALSRQDADAFAGAGSPDGRGDESATGRAKDGDAAKASVAAASVASAAPVTFAAMMQAPTAASAAPSTGIMRVDRIETLLQTAQEAAQKMQLDGSGQLELRVRLDGVADDVTVRVHLDENQQPQVNFTTASPELRTALEQGWSDLTASVATTFSNVPSESSDFSTARTSAAATEAAPNATEFYREGRRVSDASRPDNGQSARRWSGYA